MTGGPVPARTLLGWALSLALAAPALHAEVSRVEVTSRAPLDGGRTFGEVGPYEEITGRIHFLIDPAHPRNRVIANLDRAPRNRNGQVEMSADLSILAPAEAGNGNGIALVDIVNRGRKTVMRFNQAGGEDRYGDGFLMNRGYTIVWIGWEFDVPETPAAIRIDVPLSDGAPAYPIGGLGFAAVRDTAAWIRRDPGAVVSSDRALAFGSSQSGRFLRSFLYLGFNTGEDGQPVFDGVIAHIAGASRINLNEPGAEPISLGQFDATSFPFADAAYRDPVTGAAEGALDNPRARNNLPHIFYTNTSVEYWGGGRVAALVHTTPDGAEDVMLPANVRFYLLAGTQHGPGTFPPGPAANTLEAQNPVDYWWHMRALLAAMEAWIVDGEQPPPSRHPRFADGSLVMPRTLDFPPVPGVRSPEDRTAGTRAANPLAEAQGGAGALLPLLVPRVDADGNETAGVLHPEVAVPLATYTGWNFTRPERGDPDDLWPLVGAYIPFPATRAERESTGDPRPSIEERYPSRQAYLEGVRDAALRQASERYLLSADVEAVVERARRHWNLRMEGGD